MTTRQLETDYLVIGAGAMGMAFVDELLVQNPTDRVILVDKHAKPGGHWNDAYPFVKLHQPATFYGVNSEKLGRGGEALATGAEVLAYYERVLDKMLATGRVQHFPMCEFRDGRIASIVAEGLEYRVTVRKKTVDATYLQSQVPSLRPPPFPVSPEVSIVPPNGLPGVRRPRSGYVIIGAGKTGMDAVLFLLDQGVDPDHVTWIVSNDAWLWDRAQFQPRRVFDAMTGPLKNFARSSSLKEVLESLEAEKRVFRLDTDIWPTKYRCATVSREELDQLRRIDNVLRKGRVVRIDPAAVVLERGSLPTGSGTLHVDCTANGLVKKEVRPVFDGEKITLQSLAICQPTFSAAVAGYIESRYEDDEHKNHLCRVVQHPEFSEDYPAAVVATLTNTENWRREFGLWLFRSRLFSLHHASTLEVVWGMYKLRKIIPRAVRQARMMQEQELNGTRL